MEGALELVSDTIDQIVGLTIVNARWLLDRDHRLVVTIPEKVEASAAELAPGLAAA